MNETKQPVLTLDDALIGLMYYFFTTLFVLLGIHFGREFVSPLHDREALNEDFLSCFTRHDGLHYLRICTDGYSYDPNGRSEVAFFPAFPLLARGLVSLTGWRPEMALILVANAALALSFVLLRSYVRQRFPDQPASVIDFTLFSFGLFPTTFFFRMAYSEGLFLLVFLLVLIAMQNHRNLLIIALLVGLGTATRPVGIALVPGFLVHIWQKCATPRTATITSLLLLPIACWGLFAYIAFQAIEFNEPLAFITTQEHWRHVSGMPFESKCLKLVTLEPIWGVLDSASPLYWKSLETHPHGLFSLYAANPIFFCAIAVLVLYGIRKRHLSAPEGIICFGLLLLPYITKGYDNALASGGRFAAVVLPAYWVLGISATRKLAWIRAFAVASILLGLYAAMFAANYLLV